MYLEHTVVSYHWSVSIGQLVLVSYLQQLGPLSVSLMTRVTHTIVRSHTHTHLSSHTERYLRYVTTPPTCVCVTTSESRHAQCESSRNPGTHTHTHTHTQIRSVISRARDIESRREKA